jgi:phage terminase small subunit
MALPSVNYAITSFTENNMPELSNERQELFCREYVKDHNDSRAYKAAGYKCGTYNAQHSGANQLLKRIKIRARIIELERPLLEAKRKADLAVAEMAVIDRAWVVSKLVANVDRSMQAVQVTDSEGNPTGEWRYEGNVANRGLELIGKDLGMFAEKAEKAGDTYNTIMNFYLPTNDRDVTPEHQPHALGNGNGHTD